MMPFAAFALLLFTSVLSSGPVRGVDLQRASRLHMTNNMCSDCNRIVRLLTGVLSNQDSQHLIENAVDEFCHEHPVVPLCMDGARTYVHLIIRHFSAFAKQNSDVCSMLGLCGVQSEGKAAAELTEGWIDAKPSRGTSAEVQVNPICTFCVYLIKTIESLLPKQKTKEVIENLLEKICGYMPDHYKDMCDTFVHTYGDKLIDLLLSSLSPHAICAALRLCLFPDTPASLSAAQTDCDSCKTLAVLSQFHLGHNATDTQTSDLLQKICYLHPDAIPQCEVFVMLHGHRILKSDRKQPPITACLEDYLCGGHN